MTSRRPGAARCLRQATVALSLLASSHALANSCPDPHTQIAPPWSCDSTQYKPTCPPRPARYGRLCPVVLYVPVLARPSGQPDLQPSDLLIWAGGKSVPFDVTETKEVTGEQAQGCDHFRVKSYGLVPYRRYILTPKQPLPAAAEITIGRSWDAGVPAGSHTFLTTENLDRSGCETIHPPAVASLCQPHLSECLRELDPDAAPPPPPPGPDAGAPQSPDAGHDVGAAQREDARPYAAPDALGSDRDAAGDGENPDASTHQEPAPSTRRPAAAGCSVAGLPGQTPVLLVLLALAIAGRRWMRRRGLLLASWRSPLPRPEASVDFADLAGADAEQIQDGVQAGARQ